MTGPGSEYRGLAMSIYAGAFVFGVVMSSLGSILPALFEPLGFGKVDAGGLFLAMNFAMLIGSLVFGPVCDRFGYKVLLMASTLMVGGAFYAMGRAGSYNGVLAALAVLGLGGGMLNGAANALLNDISAERRASALNLLGICFGFGALSMPFLTGALLSAKGLRWILTSLVGASLAPFALFGTVRFPRAKLGGGFPRAELEKLLGNPALYLFGALLFFQSGCEFTVGGWLSTLLGEQVGLSPSLAAYVLAGYWASLMAGRLLASRLAGRVAPASLVASSAGLAGLAVTGLIFSRTGIVAAACSAAIGFGFAAVFPTTLAQVGERFSALSGTAFGVIFVMALTGGMSAPWLVGRIAQSAGVGTGLWVTVASCAAIVLLQANIRSRSRVAVAD